MLNVYVHAEGWEAVVTKVLKQQIEENHGYTAFTGIRLSKKKTFKTKMGPMMDLCYLPNTQFRK